MTTISVKIKPTLEDADRNGCVRIVIATTTGSLSIFAVPTNHIWFVTENPSAHLLTTSEMLLGWIPGQGSKNIPHWLAMASNEIVRPKKPVPVVVAPDPNKRKIRIIDTEITKG